MALASAPSTGRMAGARCTRCFVDTAATTLFLHEKIGLPNVAATLDLRHSLNAQLSLARAVALCVRCSRLFQVHVDDNYGNWDNDLVGQASFRSSLEFYYRLYQVGYDDYYDMDFFPFREDGGAVLEQSIRSTRWLAKLVACLPDETIRELHKKGDPATISHIPWEAVIKRFCGQCPRSRAGRTRYGLLRISLF